MKLSGIRHEGKAVTKGASPGPKGVANGVPGAAAPVPEVVVGIEPVAVDETGVAVALVVAVEEVGVLEMAPPALLSVAVVVVAVAMVVDIVFKKSQKNYFEFFASEVVKWRGNTIWVHGCKRVREVVRQEFNMSSPDLS